MLCEPFVTPDTGHYLSGYYDKKVVSDDGQNLCCLQVPYVDRLAPLASDQGPAAITIFNMQEKYEKVIGHTQAWNFQLGCGLQFINMDRGLIFLAIKGNKVVTRIVDLDGNLEDEIDLAYYSFNDIANGFIGINQDRYSSFRPGYSYPTKTQKSFLNYDEDDYIYFYNIERQEKTILITMGDLGDFPSPIPFKDSVNYMEHLTFAPCGTKFVFVHRFVTANGQLYSRLFLYDMSKKKLDLLHSKGRVTHFNWLDVNRLIVWQGGDTPAQTVRNMRFIRNNAKVFSKIYKVFVRSNSEVGLSRISRYLTGDGFAVIDTSNGNIEENAFKQITNDGHPSVAGDDLIISDTYPFGSGNVIELYSFDVAKGLRSIIAKIPHPKEYNLTSLRCDAHPKVNVKSRTVAFDRFLGSLRSVQVGKY